jgi:hypothetical protein
MVGWQSFDVSAAAVAAVEDCADLTERHKASAVLQRHVLSLAMSCDAVQRWDEAAVTNIGSSTRADIDVSPKQLVAAVLVQLLPEQVGQHSPGLCSPQSRGAGRSHCVGNVMAPVRFAKLWPRPHQDRSGAYPV